jgi:hypothetical protein
LKSFFERVLTTFVVAFLGTLPMTMDLTHSNYKALALSGIGAGIAAVIALLKTVVWKPASPDVWVNTAERFAWSFVQGGIAALPATIVLSPTGLTAAFWVFASAGATAFLSLAKNLTGASSPNAKAAAVLNTELAPTVH